MHEHNLVKFLETIRPYLALTTLYLPGIKLRPLVVYTGLCFARDLPPHLGVVTAYQFSHRVSTRSKE